MLLATAVWLLVATHPIAAREAVDTASLHPGITNLLQPGYLEGRLATYSNQTGLAAAEVQELLKVGQQCLALRGDLIRLDSERQAFLATTQSASNRLVELNLRLKERVSEAGIDLPPDASVSVIKQKAAEIEADLAVARAELDRLDLEPKRRADRRIKIAGLLADSRRDSGELDDAPEQGVDSPDAEPLKQALAIRRALQTELNLQTVRNLNLELASFEATTDLVTAQQALARRKVAFLDKQLTRVKDALNRGRQQESARAALEAERAQQRADALNLPTVTALAETNKELAQVRVSVAKLMAETSRQLDEAEQQWRLLHSNHESIRQLVQIAKESGVAQDTAIGLA
ncbi:MAG: hypothetical protein MUC91_02590, partial [Verrucomicrobia bacterium]|nr:hypothetical protein [Verrucomicrobiota bacterium]